MNHDEEGVLHPEARRSQAIGGVAERRAYRKARSRSRSLRPVALQDRAAVVAALGLEDPERGR